MIRFEVKINGSWIEAELGIILQYNRLSFRLADGRSGIASIGEWQLSQATINDPAFKRACWDALTSAEKEAALLRRSGVASQGVHSRSVLVA